MDVSVGEFDRPVCLFGEIKIVIQRSRIIASRLVILGCDFIDERSEKEIEKAEALRKIAEERQHLLLE